MNIERIYCEKAQSSTLKPHLIYQTLKKQSVSDLIFCFLAVYISFLLICTRNFFFPYQEHLLILRLEPLFFLYFYTFYESSNT